MLKLKKKFRRQKVKSSLYHVSPAATEKNYAFSKQRAITCLTRGICKKKKTVTRQSVTSTRTEKEWIVNLHHFSLERNLIQSGKSRRKSASKLDMAFQDTNRYIRWRIKKRTQYVPSGACDIHLSRTVIFVRKVTTPPASTSEGQHQAPANFVLWCVPFSQYKNKYFCTTHKSFVLCNGTQSFMWGTRNF